jgi:thiol-disulfide isomerase/thioredoxin
MGQVAKQLRARLEASIRDEDLSRWDDLWKLEFKLKPVPEHGEIRQQIAADLKRLRAKSLNSREWLSALQAGYKLVDDRDGKSWTESEQRRLFPITGNGPQAARQRWYADNPSPKNTDPPEKKQAYYQALYKATGEWIKLWPDDATVRSSRFFAAQQLETLPNAEIIAAAEGLLKTFEKNDFDVRISTVMDIAAAYAKRGIATAHIPSLVLKAFEQAEKNDSRIEKSDLRTPEEGLESGKLKTVRWQGWPILVEAFCKLRQPAKAQEILEQMAEALRKEKPSEKATQWVKTVYANNQVAYWRSAGRLAEIENRKLDALIYYQTALSYRPKAESATNMDKKDELAENASSLWKVMGGTVEGWNAYLGLNSTAKMVAETAVTWDAKDLALPDFTLTDLQGKKWRLADLKGKVAFINFWATWCGPCKAELPYVQKLHDKMKDSMDVLILTFNIDEELGLVEPFIKENKYTFTVVPAQAYANGLDVYSIPRNWVIDEKGLLRFEGMGFMGVGEEWMKRATEMIERVKSNGK